MTYDQYVKECPYCGGSEIIEAYQSAYGSIYAVNNMWGGAYLYHSVCRGCGSVLRSYVKEPEKLLKRRDRKKN